MFLFRCLPATGVVEFRLSLNFLCFNCYVLSTLRSSVVQPQAGRIYSYFKKGWWRFCCMLHTYQARNALWAMWKESTKGHNNVDSANFPKLCLCNMEPSYFLLYVACWHYLFMIQWYISGLVCKMQDARCNKTLTNLFSNSCIYTNYINKVTMWLIA